MYYYTMYCQIYGIAYGAILKKKYMENLGRAIRCDSGAILPFLNSSGTYSTTYCTSTVYTGKLGDAVVSTQLLVPSKPYQYVYTGIYGTTTVTQSPSQSSLPVYTGI